MTLPASVSPDVGERFFGYDGETAVALQRDVEHLRLVPRPVVTLRPMGTDQDDLGRTFVWCNLPDVAKYMYRDHEISYNEHNAWFQAQKDTWVRWIAEVDGEPIGFAQLYAINRKDGTFEWGDYIALTEARGKGYGKWIKFLIHEHGFETLGLRKASCEVFADNLSVWSSHLKFGYRMEGYFTAHVMKGGTARDVVRVGMLRDDWDRAKPKIMASLRCSAA